MRMRLLLGAAIMVLAPAAAMAQSATWSGAGSNYGDAGNWTPATVPTDTATFGATGSTSLTSVAGSIATLQFGSGAPAYTFGIDGPGAIFNVTGTGVVNNSAARPIFNITAGFGGALNFNNNASAGNAIINQNVGGLNFNNNAGAGGATINVNGSGLFAEFLNAATAGTATINLIDGAAEFRNTASAGSANLVLTGAGMVNFFDSASGGTASFDLQDDTTILDFSAITGGTGQAGAITGLGTVWLGGNSVSIGGNNQSGIFGGVIADCTSDCQAHPLSLPEAPGTLKKTGSGTLTLTGANIYTGNTIIDAGTLQIGNGGAAGSILGNVANSGMLSFNRSNAYAFGGVISGSGAVNVIGAGVLSFSAAQTYSGATTVNSGSTLSLTGGGNLANSLLTDNGSFDISGTTSGASIMALAGSGGVTLGSKTLSLNNAGSATTFSGAIGGSGGLTLAAGHQILSGTSGYSGPTTVNGGTLSVNGAIASSPVTVNSGGTLGGTGTTGAATIASGGTLAPGNSIGTIHVAGNLVFAAGGTYHIEVSPAAADKTEATGTASLNGAVEADFAAGGGYVPGRYAIVTSTGALSGAFTSLSTNGLPAGLTASLTYDANDAYLNLLGGNASGGLIHASLTGAYIEDERLIRNAVLDHLLTEAGGPRVWGEGFAAFGALGVQDPLDHNHNGFIAGMDMPLGGGFTLGVAGAWTGYKAAMPSKSSSARGESGHAAAYAGWNNLMDGGGWMLKLGGEYGWGAVNTTRFTVLTGETDSAHQAANTAQIFGEAAWRIHFDGAELEPHGSLFWVMGETGAFSETGGILAMSGTALHQDAAFAKLGVRGLGRWIDLGGMEIAPDLDIGVQMALSNPRPSLTVGFATGTPTVLTGAVLAQTAGTAQLGLGVRLGEDAALHLGYDGIFSTSQLDHAVTARVEIHF